MPRSLTLCGPLPENSEAVSRRRGRVSGAMQPIVDCGARTARKAGVSDERLADRPEPASDEVWDTAATYFDEKQPAAIVLMVGVTNLKKAAVGAAARHDDASCQLAYIGGPPHE